MVNLCGFLVSWIEFPNHEIKTPVLNFYLENY